MGVAEHQILAKVIEQCESELLDEWVKEQLSSGALRRDRLKDSELREQSRMFLKELRIVLAHSASTDTQEQHWNVLRNTLEEITRYRALLGFSPSETATFIFSFKKPLFAKIVAQLESAQAVKATCQASEVLDQLGLYTTEIHQKAREDVISRQQDEMLELSTPVVELWDGVLALPIIGTLDSRRTQMVMENLLQRIVETGSEIAIIDITGVPTVDTVTAQHLLKTITATRLMGAECIISGIRPQIAQTIVHLGVELGDVLTKSSMAGALKLALTRRKLAVVSVA